MPGEMIPDQMYDHECNVLKGWLPDMHCLDKQAPLASGEVINAGSVCYIDEDGLFRLGFPDNVMPCIAWPNSFDFDVSSDVGNINKAVMNALPCIGAYEVQTTEFDGTQTYKINDHLTAWDVQHSGYTAALKGKVRPGLPYQHTLCGVCSDVVKKNDKGLNFLSFWTYYLPVDLTIVSS
jgi:hypothetical protein